MATTADDLWALLRELIEAQKETARETQETKRMFQETDRKMRRTDRQIKELGKQIGGLGEKFGSFTEGLALPSMEKILRLRFGMEVVSPSVRATKDGRHLELDVLSYANGPVNAAYLVEVKSHLREEAIGQLKDILHQFREFFPEHRDKRLFGILAAVDLTAAMRERVLREGFYAARIHDQVFDLDVPDGFQPRVY
ncbi:DUF3782 domain-containing protein [uncultured Lamprocystis sp.]|jgi:hypothetical protein|uniref:DUF3782 domain-containing protein n=1 Tax=uncultured Lamprocystis sp. TaxID=543132 RepID=UPI0025FEACC8|nr:DUF3782 domain-containing protein [uncultured Lamprocystis sp.]